MRFFLLLPAFLFFANIAHSAWDERADFGAEGRHRAVGFAIHNKGYIGLGHYNGTGTNIVKADWWEYDPATNSWTQKANYIGNNGNGNYGSITFVIGDYGYIGGGALASSSFYRYSPGTNTWEAKANTPTTVSNQSAFAVEDKGYYIANDELHMYDPALDSWSTLNPPPVSPVQWNSSFTIGNKAYIKHINGFWEYKPQTDTWIARAQFPGLARYASVSFSQNGKGYIVTGFGAGGLSDVNSEVWEYDVQLNSWTLLDEFPGTSRRFAVGFTIGNKAYLGTGTNGTNFNDFWEFDATASQEEINPAFSILAYPNPIVDDLNLKTGIPGQYTVTVIDPNGRIVLSDPKMNDLRAIDCSTWTPGIYEVLLETEDNSLYSETVVKH